MRRRRDTHTDRHTHRHTDRRTQRHTDTQTDTQTNTDRHTDTRTHTQTHRQTHRHTHRQTHTQTDTQTHRQTGTQTHRHTHRQTHTQKHTDNSFKAICFPFRSIGLSDNLKEQTGALMADNLSHPSTTIRKASIKTVMELNYTSTKAVIGIVSCLNDKSADLRNDAKNALEHLLGEYFYFVKF